MPCAGTPVSLDLVVRTASLLVANPDLSGLDHTKACPHSRTTTVIITALVITTVIASAVIAFAVFTAAVIASLPPVSQSRENEA